MTFQGTIELLGKSVDGIGVGITVVGAISSLGAFALRFSRGQRGVDSYRSARGGLGRSILLGLELLVAGDIIRTVAISPTLLNVGVLALIVLVRTFLSMALEVEIESRWPWKGQALGTRSGEVTPPARFSDT